MMVERDGMHTTDCGIGALVADALRGERVDHGVRATVPPLQRSVS